MQHDFALPWIARSDEGGVYIDDAHGNTVCGMVALDSLPAMREFTHAELIVRCVNAYAHEVAGNIRGTMQEMTRELVSPSK